MGHTRKHLVWSGWTGGYVLRVYSSGGVLHTGEVTSVSNGRTVHQSFRSRYTNNRQRAIDWCKDKAANYEEAELVRGAK